MTRSRVNNHPSGLINNHQSIILMYYLEGYLFSDHLYWLHRRNDHFEFVTYINHQGLSRRLSIYRNKSAEK